MLVTLRALLIRKERANALELTQVQEEEWKRRDLSRYFPTYPKQIKDEINLRVFSCEVDN